MLCYSRTAFNKKDLKILIFQYLQVFLSAGEEGIEPPLTVLETAALPLYYSPMDQIYHESISFHSVDDHLAAVRQEYGHDLLTKAIITHMWWL